MPVPLSMGDRCEFCKVTAVETMSLKKEFARTPFSGIATEKPTSQYQSPVNECFEDLPLIENH